MKTCFSLVPLALLALIAGCGGSAVASGPPAAKAAAPIPSSVGPPPTAAPISPPAPIPPSSSSSPIDGVVAAVKTAPAPPKSSPATLRRLQGALQQDGFPPGPVNGQLDRLTKRAMSSFETVYGLSSKSTPDQLLKAALQPPPPKHQRVLGFYVEGAGSKASFKAHTADVSSISPLWYGIRATGAVRHRGSPGDVDRITAAAHAAGKRVYAIVTNLGGNSAMLHNPSVRVAAIGQLVALAKTHHLDGINVDFEGINGRSAAGLVAFVQALHQRLAPLGMVTSVDVGARMRSNLPPSSPTAAYDYAALGRAADLVVLMTYDQHGPGTGPGPVAGWGFMQSTLSYALHTIPPGKILLGIADYGYTWGSTGAATIGAQAAEALASSLGITPMWSPSSRSTYFSYVRGGTRHVVWYSGARAVAARLQLVLSDHLAGVALWRLGQEDSATMNTFGRTLSIVP